MKIEKWKGYLNDYVTLKNCSVILEKEEYDFLKKKAAESYEYYGKEYTLNKCIEMEIRAAIRNYHEQERRENYILK